MGLLDFNMPGIDTPQGQGLLAAAFSLMGAKGNSMSEAVGDAGRQYMGVYQNARSLEDQKKLRDLQMKQAQMQMDEAQRAVDERNWMRTTAQKYAKPAGVTTSMQPVNAPGDVGPDLFSRSPSNMVKPVETATPASFDIAGFMNEYMQRDPLDATAKMRELTAPDYMAVSEGSTLIDKRTGRTVMSNPKTATPSDLARLTQEMLALPAGSPMRQVYEAAIRKAVTHAPAPSASVSVAMDKGMAQQIGPMMKDSKAAADGAVQTADAAARVIQATQSGQVLLGPAADARLRIKQISSMLGVGGKDDAEIIANTRQAIRGLAEMTLQGRKQMTGQGAITDRESALAEKATSGDINDLTPQELVELARASARASRYVYDSHQRMIDAAMKDPEGAKLVPFYRTGNFPSFNFNFDQMTPQGGVDVRSKADAILGGK